jgi:hypothetical protein
MSGNRLPHLPTFEGNSMKGSYMYKRTTTSVVLLLYHPSLLTARIDPRPAALVLLLASGKQPSSWVVFPQLLIRILYRPCRLPFL